MKHHLAVGLIIFVCFLIGQGAWRFVEFL